MPGSVNNFVHLIGLQYVHGGGGILQRMYLYASTTALLGDPGAQTPVSFQMLLYELTWGCYRGQPFPPSLQQLLFPTDGKGKHTPTPAPLLPRDDNPRDADQGQGNGRDSEFMAKYIPIVRLSILPGKNTQDYLRNKALSIVSWFTFCKCWHLGMSYFSQYAQVASHLYLLHATLDTVIGALTAERVVAAMAAVQ